ncbi:Ig-like domain-containing protein [Litoreibacter albidus]|uniref:Ig-like domain (Group 3) n=1 Tax=Litoreibacter albidus TaxID=670155 RepID=A0A1H2SIK6_9RHOB|nr:Ig-like domain-containing protein [Litoreibacter albidus]SDW31402.1 Ig-like domain (group 3) [Litoreibacter albidus]
MEAIEFVVRDRAGNIRRGMLAQSESADTIFINSGDDVSLNLRRYQVAGYERSGDTVIVTLADGRKIRLEGYFGADADLYISADGILTEVDLAGAQEGLVDAEYAEAQIFGKWSPDDALYYVGGSEVDAVIAAGAAEEETATMLAAPILAGLGGAGATGLGAAAAVVGGAAVIGGAGGGGGGAADTEAPEVSLDSGVVSVDHVFDAEDHADGVEVGGSGEAGVAIVVDINGETQETVVGEDGTWQVVFDPTQVPEGEYDVDVTITATDAAGNATTITDVVRVDTVTTVGVVAIDGAATGSGDVINAVEHADGVTLTGTGEVGANVVITIAENGATANAVVDADGNWSADFTADQVSTGEYSTTVTVTSTDAYGNQATATAQMVVDTFTEVAITGNNSGADGIYNGAEVGNATVMNGTAQPGSSVVVTLTGENGQTLGAQTVTATSSGEWSAEFAGGTLPGGEYNATVTAVATDAAGNTATSSSTFPVDTVTNVAITGNNAGADGVYNNAEAATVAELSGTAQAGSTVVVTLAGPTGQTLGAQTVTATSGGTWTVQYPSNTLPSGEYDVTVTAVATDASGNSETTSATIPVDTITHVEITTIDGDAAGTGVINAVEHADGVTMSGTGEAGGNVTVAVAGGGTATGVVGADGTWNVTFQPAQIPSGERAVDVSVSIRDQAGNTDTATSTMQIDTLTNVAITGNNTGADNVMNLAESASGTALTGTAQPGASVVVSMTTEAGVALGSQTIIANFNGTWTANFSANTLPGGEYNVNVSAVATDGAGNTASTTSTFAVDTVADVSVNTVNVEGDNIINIAEASDGVQISGTAEANSRVEVDFGGATRTVVTDSNGNWQAAFGPNDVPAGVETTVPVRATFTDAAGNTAVANGTVEVDTIVRNLGVNQVTGDGVVDASEAATGFTLTGTTEAGAQGVMVTFHNLPARAATIQPNGSWSVTFGPNEIPQGEYTSEVKVTTIDRNGNPDSVSTPVTVDTEVPDAPVVISYTEYFRGDPGVSGIGTELTDDIVAISQVSETGVVGNVNYDTNVVRGDELQFSFNNRIPDGSNLVVNAEDSVGNESATLLVLDDNAVGTVNVSLNGLQSFNVSAIDLSIVAESELTLSEADLLGLSDDTNALLIHGDNTDTVNIAGAKKTTLTEEVDGRHYDVYTLGDDGSLLIENQIIVNY